MKQFSIKNNFAIAEDKYRALGINVQEALDKLKKIPLSIHCWQGDDVSGFEHPDASLSGGGIQVTGNYPGKARNITELRQDLEKVYSLLPGRHRLNLHAIYGEFGGNTVDRDKIQPKHFSGWVDWAKANSINLDFNATFFTHPKADSGFTLSSKQKGIRDFWIEHVKSCRAISAYIGSKLANPCLHNLWIPDGSKDIPIDRMGYRTNLKQALDQIYAIKYPPKQMKDSLESKLFGIGSEAFVVGSHEFYMGYALTRNKIICLDLGHFHAQELIADKISACLQFSQELLLHVSRPVRWDSDHVVILNDDIRYLCHEIVYSNRINDIHIGLDFFDATLNRIGAWVIGSRSVLKGLLIALLEPYERMKAAEDNGDYFSRLALLEECKTLPNGLVWDYYCYMNGVPTDRELIKEILTYEKQVTIKRG